MIRQDRRLSVAFVLLALNLLVIWGNSLLPGDISAAISGWVRDFLSVPMHGLGGGSNGAASGDGLIRKMGHFLEFACLGAILCRIFLLLGKPRLWAMVLGALAGCVDETIQIFVPDRGPAVTDVLLDAFGVLCGVFLLSAVVWLGRKIIKVKQ